MVKKWEIGAMINVTGSIAINLGTNLMKLSHKMNKGELPPGACGTSHTPASVSPSDNELGQAESGTAPQKRISSPTAPKGGDMELRGCKVATGRQSGSKDGPERVASKGVAKGLKAGRNWANLRHGEDDEEAALLTEESLTDSPFSATGSTESSPDRTAMRVKPRLQEGIVDENGHGQRSGGEGGFDDYRGVRRRAMSSPRQGLLSKMSSEEEMEAGPAMRARTGDELHGKAKAVWYLGAVMLVAGSLVNFASFGFAPQSLLSSLGSVQFVSNVIFGKVILQEIVTRRIILGTATIILGNTLTLCFSPHQDANYDTVQLKAFYDLEYNAILFLEMAIAFTMHTIYKSLKASKERGRAKPCADLAMPLAYAICSAIVGTQSVVQAKCLSELLTMTFNGQNQMASPFTYLVIAIWLGTTVFWLTRMNRALAMFHGLFIIPALQVFWTFFSIIGGGFYFEEFKSLDMSGASGFAFGVTVVFVGVYLLAPRTQIDHGKHVGQARGGNGEELEDENSDLQKMLRLEDDSPAGSSSGDGGTLTQAETSPNTMEGTAPEATLEAGDEEIDWDHTRMLSLGFFPSILTDQDVGYLTDAIEGPERVVKRLNPWKGDAQGDASGSRVPSSGRDRSGYTRQKDTPPPTNPPDKVRSDPSFLSDSSETSLGVDVDGGNSGLRDEGRRRRRSSTSGERGSQDATTLPAL